MLVVDDEEAIAEYFRIILSAEQYDVVVVASLQRAIEEFTRHPDRFDTVLLDMMLGDGTGLELYRRIRDMRPALPVVVCTGFAENESLEIIREDGHDVLLKPCTRHEVLRAIGRAMARRRRSSGREDSPSAVQRPVRLRPCCPARVFSALTPREGCDSMPPPAPWRPSSASAPLRRTRRSPGETAAGPVGHPAMP